MTYGENSRELRDSMAWLLGRHRILQRLGGPGQHTIPAWSTEAERQRMGQMIARYRHATLTWCLQAVTATTPKTDLTGTTGTSRNPVEDLRYRLGDAVHAVAPGEPLSMLLATRHDNALMDAWQRLARAAALGEHDVTGGVSYGDLTPEQSRTVLKDAADLTRALVILDARYRNIPGWQHLKESRRLGRAAEATSLTVARQGHDVGVDARGWRPAARVIRRSALPGVAGAVQAQHNMLLALTRFPNALNLRRILHSQAEVSHAAAQHAATAAPELVDRFTRRTDLYRELVHTSRSLGGLIGDGSKAVIESQNTASRLHRTPASRIEAGKSLHELARLFTRTDARIATTIEHGYHQKLYFVSTNIPRLDNDNLHGVTPVHQRWVPVTSLAQTPLIGLVRDQLRLPPTPVAHAAPTSSRSRAAFNATLTQQAARVGHARSPR